MSINIEKIVSAIVPPDKRIFEKASKRTARLLMPPRALGQLHNISEKLCAICGTLKPDVKKKSFIVFACDHGVTQEGVSAYPQEVTAQMIKAFISGQRRQRPLPPQAT